MVLPLPLRHIAIIVLALAVAWQVVSLHVSNHYVNLALSGVDGAVKTALWWDSANPRALEIAGMNALREARADASVNEVGIQQEAQQGDQQGGQQEGQQSQQGATQGGEASQASTSSDSGFADFTGAPDTESETEPAVMSIQLDPQKQAQGEALLKQSLSLAPTEGRVLANLAVLAQRQSAGEGKELALAADRLGPVEPRTQRNLVAYALATDDLAEAVIHIARTMVGEPENRARFYPLLMRIAAEPSARQVLVAIASDPTPFPWWNSFFAYVAREAENMDALRALVQLRENSTALPLQEYERNLYVNRLRKEGLISEAYLHWVNGLTSEQLQTLGYLYDGSFEHDFSNDSGFGWVARPPKNSGIRVSRGDTYGVSGDVALQIAFNGRRVRFSHVYQSVFLAPGRYRVSGRARPDKLEARRGLEWRVYCSSGMSGVLGTSQLFVGTGDWRPFDFEVIVPVECSGQIIRLYSAGSREVDHELKGVVWFDDLRIELNKTEPVVNDAQLGSQNGSTPIGDSQASNAQAIVSQVNVSQKQQVGNK